MQWKLLPKLLIVVFVIIVAVTAVGWLAIDYFAEDYFSYLLDSYRVPGKHEILKMFRDAAHRGLLVGAGVSLVLGTIIGLLLLRRVLGPLYDVIAITRRIAAGDYSSRIERTARDEIGELGDAFNAMVDRLRRVEELRRRAVVDVAHELRAPLTNIRGYLDAVATDVLPMTPETLQALQAETLRLADLAEDLMRLSVADAARSTMVRSEVDVVELLRRSLALFGAQLPQKATRISTRLPPTPLVISADAEKLAQVFQNLLDNAWQYTPDGGSIEASIDATGDSVTISFCNTGAPLTQEECVLVFERFYRVDPSRSRDHGGAGIGLAIVKELVEAHGGQVGARNDDDRNCFFFTLPRRAPA